MRHGLAAALPEVVGISVNGRGERSHTTATDLNVPLALMIELRGREAWLRSA